MNNDYETEAKREARMKSLRALINHLCFFYGDLLGNDQTSQSNQEIGEVIMELALWELTNPLDGLDFEDKKNSFLRELESIHQYRT